MKLNHSSHAGSPEIPLEKSSAMSLGIFPFQLIISLLSSSIISHGKAYVRHKQHCFSNNSTSQKEVSCHLFFNLAQITHRIWMTNLPCTWRRTGNIRGVQVCRQILQSQPSCRLDFSTYINVLDPLLSLPTPGVPSLKWFWHSCVPEQALCAVLHLKTLFICYQRGAQAPSKPALWFPLCKGALVHLPNSQGLGKCTLLTWGRSSKICCCS